MEQGLHLLASRQVFIICMLGLMLLLICIVKRISKTYIARLIVRLQVNSRLSAVPVPTLCYVVPSHLEGHCRKLEGRIKIFRPGLRAGICAIHFQIASGTTERIVPPW